MNTCARLPILLPVLLLAWSGHASPEAAPGTAAVSAAATGPAAQEAGAAAPAPILRIEAGMHTGTIWRIATDAQGRWAATASDDKTTRVWELPSGRLAGVLRPPVGEGNVGRLFAVAMSPDGNVVATSGWTGDSTRGHPVYLYERATGRLLRTLGGAQAAVKHLAFNHDGSALAAGLGTGAGVMVWSLAAQPGADHERYGQDGMPQSARVPGEVLGLAWTRTDRLAAASLAGSVQLYEVGAGGLRLLRATRTAGGQQPVGLACNPRTGQLAVAFADSPHVDVLDGETLQRLFSPPEPGDTGAQPLLNVAWSPDGQNLYAAGAAMLDQRTLLRRWPASGRGKPVDTTTSADSVTGLAALPKGVLLASASPDWGLVDEHDHWQLLGRRPTLDLRTTPTAAALRVSEDGRNVAFVPQPGAGPLLQFDLERRQLLVTAGRPLFPPALESLPVAELTGAPPARFDGQALPLPAAETVLSLAAPHAGTGASAGTGFVLGTLWSLRAFGAHGHVLWTRPAPAPVWAVNIPPKAPGLVVAAYGDGTVRWHRLSDGQELLALFVHADGKRWVLWAPSGQYEAGPGSEDLFGWQVPGHGGAPAEFVGTASLGERMRRPDLALRVLQAQELGSAPALGATDAGTGGDHAKAAQTAQASPAEAAPHAPAARETPSWERPNLFVLAVGVSDYESPDIPQLGLPAKDASDFASVISHQQGLLYRDVVTRVLTNAQATKDDILDGLDWLQKQVTQHDVGMLFLAGHGLNDPQLGYTFLPVNADLDRLKRTAVTMSDIRSTLSSLVGKAVFFLDTCHAGNALGGARRGVDDDLMGAIKELADTENGVVVFSSSTGRQDSLEDPAWGNGAFTKALIEGLEGRADYEHNGRITHKMLDLYVSERVKDLTHGKQSPVTLSPGGVPDFPLVILDRDDPSSTAVLPR